MTNPIPKDWKQSKLGKIANNVMYGMNSASTDFDGQNKYLRITDINERTNKFSRKSLTSPLNDLDEKFILKENDLIFARTGASVGKSYLYNREDGTVYFAGFLIRFNINKLVSSKFIFLQTLLPRYRNWVSVMSTRSGQPGINAEEYKKLPVLLPPLPEQHRIVAVLETWNNTIEALTQKIELKKNIKKGLMQELLTGKKRLKGFLKEWKIVSFEDVISSFSTGLNPRKNFKLGHGNNYYVTIKNINSGELKFSTCEKVDDKALKLINKRSRLSNGDIIMSSIGNVGEAYLLTENPHNWDINESVFCLKPNYLKVTSDFIYHFITSEIAKRYFENNITGSSFKSIKMKSLRIMPFLLPSKEEQIAIAQIFTTADDEITALKKKKQILEDQKKYLLNNLITGQVRAPENLTIPKS